MARLVTDPDLISRIIKAESSGNPTARNPRSSAGGLGQFLDSTWLATVRQHAPELAGLPNSEILRMKTDGSESGVAFQRRMLDAFTQDNIRGLQSSGIEPTGGNVYLAHFLGLGGARKALSANPGASVRSVMGDAVVNANPFLKDMSVADMVAWASRKGGEGQGAAPSSGTRMLASASPSPSGPMPEFAGSDSVPYAASNPFAEENALASILGRERPIEPPRRNVLALTPLEAPVSRNAILAAMNPHALRTRRA